MVGLRRTRSAQNQKRCTLLIAIDICMNNVIRDISKNPELQ